MISIFIMYSNDRLQQLEYTVSCLRDMTGYEDCQKTLVVDTRLDMPIHKNYPEFSLVEVPRINGQFCWSDMWQAGVLTARHEKILYLDSDRLLPRDYLRTLGHEMTDDAFYFTTKHFMVSDPDISLDSCKKFLLNYSSDPAIFLNEEYMGNISFEPRNSEPVHGPGKNVMSGNTGFTKRTFLKLGGVDRFYCGHGAFADTDFHLQAHVGGCRFVDLGIPELHCHHLKRNKNDEAVDPLELKRMGLDNFIYYCWKWNLSFSLAESVAYDCGIVRPSVHVSKKVRELEHAKESLRTGRSYPE